MSLSLSSLRPAAKVGQRLRTALNRSARRDADGGLTIVPRQVYILPTRYGVIFAGMLFAMLLGSHNYGLNLGFMLTFLLTGLGFSALLQTWRNLAGLQIRATAVEPVFLTQTARFGFVLVNRRSSPRYSLQIQADRQPPGCIDLAGGEQQSLSVAVLPPRRGRYRPARFTVFTFFPLGLFYAWAYFHTDQHCLVFPSPADQAAGHDTHASATAARRRQPQDGDEFFAHRGYQAGDPLNRIDWKALARGHGLLVKHYAGSPHEQLWLNWSALPNTGLEQRLSLLCRAVLELSRQNRRFGLRLPGKTVPPGEGSAHRYRCLAALGLFYAVED